MPSFIWNRTPQEAMDNPYEYEAQEQFAREASNILGLISDELENHDRQFTRDDRTIDKAVWMLQNDALDSLKGILTSLNEKHHRIAGKLFRDVIESLDLAAYFHTDSIESNKNLTKWYNDEIIPHRVYRDYIKKNLGQEASNESRDYYRIISKFTHRTYNILLYSYVLGRNEIIAYDGFSNSKLLVLPQTIAMYYAILADFIKFTSIEFGIRGLINGDRIKEIWAEGLEEESVPQRFLTKEQIYQKYKKHKNGS